MKLVEKEKRLIAELMQFHPGQDRLGELVRRARALPPLDPALKTEAHRLEGCLARLWLVSEFREGRCWFRCDSDSLVTKGVASALCEFYSGASPEEIATHGPDFLREIGITQHLTPNRRNGLSRIRQRIQEFARSQVDSDEPKPVSPE